MTNSADDMPQRNALDRLTATERQELDRMVIEGIAAFRARFARWKAEKQAGQAHKPLDT